MNKLLNDSLPYITGMGYRKLCDFYVDEFEVSDFSNTFDGMNVFVKTDALDFFFESIAGKIKNEYNIYSHNSDINITERYLKYIENNSFLNQWFAQNVNVSHKKLIPIPLGIANARWPQGNVQTYKKIQDENNQKERLFYFNVNASTNVVDRMNCIQNISVSNEKPVDFETYLREISRSYFVISPLGNGIDTHRNWESIYLNSVAITVRTKMSEYFLKNKLPFHLLNNWSEFEENLFTPDYYFELMKQYDNQNNKIYLKKLI